MQDKPHDPAASSTQVAYQFARAAGYNVLGTEDAFVLLLDDLGSRKYVALFGNLELAPDVSFEQQAAHEALEMARALNAAFSIVGDAVQCEVSGQKVIGATYIDAAMRAVAQHHLSSARTAKSVATG